MPEFARAFDEADRVEILDIYAASEEPIAGVTGEALVQQIGRDGMRYAGSMAEGVEALAREGSRGRYDSDAGGWKRCRMPPDLLLERLEGTASIAERWCDQRG